MIPKLIPAHLLVVASIASAAPGLAAETRDPAFTPLNQVVASLEAATSAKSGSRRQALKEIAGESRSALGTLAIMLTAPDGGGSCKYFPAPIVDHAHPPASNLRDALAMAKSLAWGGVIGIEPGFLGNQPGTLITLQLGDHTANLPPVARFFLPVASFNVGGQSFCVFGQHAPMLPVAIDDVVYILLPEGRTGGDDLYLPATDLEFLVSPSAMLPTGYPRESQFTIDEFGRAFQQALDEQLRSD